MDNAVHTIEKDGFIAKLFQDTDAMNPREDKDNLGTMVYWHRRMKVGDVDGSKEFGEPEEFLKQATEGKWIVLPVSMLDHSGQTIWVGAGSSPFDPGGWDSGQVGFIYITPEKARKEYGWKHITKGRVKKLVEYLTGEVKEFDQYLTGDVYGYTITDEDGNVMDSCWGFFGHEYAKQEMASQLDASIAYEREQVQKIEWMMAL